ncbi:hypothetical protein BDQ17DRAFT_1363163 [Cyathus striatus]|nr:hypothetical protein BDQ17DRAFT_1363163 [Cyathus striatus]
MESHGTVPPDIVDLIIDEVALLNNTSSRFPALKSCSLACRYFLESSRRHLFHSLTLSSKFQNKILALHDILTSSPGISTHIRKLHLLLNPRNSIHADQNSLPKLLHMLNNITTFALRFDSTNMRYSWLELTSAMQEALYAILQSPSIIHLSISNVHELPKSLRTCLASIPTITLSSVSFQTAGNTEDIPDQPSNPFSSTRCIRNLTISNVSLETSQPLLDALSISHGELETLLCYDDGDPNRSMEVATMILQRCGDFLTKLECWNMDVARQLDISTVPRLHTIKLLANFTSQIPIPLCYIRQILETPSEKNEIKEVFLGILLSQLSSYETDWKSLDSLLTGPKFTQLKKVNFKVDLPLTAYRRGEQYVGKTRMELPSLMQSVLPKMHERGLIEVKMGN